MMENIYENNLELITMLLDNLRYKLGEQTIALWFIRQGATNDELKSMDFEEEDIRKAREKYGDEQSGLENIIS